MTLNLDTRQRAMLAAMGVRVWQPTQATTPPEAPTPAPPVQALARAPAPAPLPERTPVAAPTIATVNAPAVARPPLPTSLADMDWTGLQAAARDCQACGLCETRQRSVFASGQRTHESTRTDWLIVTDPPTEEEERQGSLLLGTEGELFDAMLASLGLSRQDAAQPESVTVVPVLKCRVPDQRNPQPDELQQCRAFLERQVALLQPQVILAMGRWAVQSLLSATSSELAALPLGKQRGQVHHFANTPLVVTYTPQSLLRTPLDKAKAWADLCLAHSLTRRP